MDISTRRDAEQAVIRCLIAEPGRLDEIRPLLMAKHFSEPRNREVFDAISARTGDAVECPKSQHEAAVDLNVNPGHIRNYAEIVVEGWKREQVTRIAGELLRAAQEGITPMDDVLAIGREKLQSI